MKNNKKNILIVDNQPLMLKSLEKLLSRDKDFILTLIQDPRQALKLTANKKFDLVITDLKMPEISGLDILRAAIDNWPATIVIVISGYGTNETIAECMKNGAFDFINKPFSSKTLFDTVRRALNENYFE